MVGLRSADGDVKCALSDSAEGFPADSSKAIKTTSGPVRDGTLDGDFDRLPAGEYGISVYHEMNSNGKLDRNFVGIPKEGVAQAMTLPVPSVRFPSTTPASPIQGESRPSPSTSAIYDGVTE